MAHYDELCAVGLDEDFDNADKYLVPIEGAPLPPLIPDATRPQEVLARPSDSPVTLL